MMNILSKYISVKNKKHSTLFYILVFSIFQNPYWLNNTHLEVNMKCHLHTQPNALEYAELL